MASESTGATPQALLAHAEWVRRLAAALVRADDADDVAQQALAQALVAPPPSRNLRAWFAAIVRNVARRRRRDEATRARYEAFAPEAIESGDPALAVARAELHRRVVDAVLALAEPYRSTLVLRFFDEKPAEEIARAQALPLETVRTRVKRGLAQLRAQLDEGGREGGTTLRRSLALLLVVPSARAASVTGALGMGATSKGLLAAVGALVVAAVAWRWMEPNESATMHRDAAVPMSAAAAVPVAETLPLAERKIEASNAATGGGATEPSEFSIEGRVVDEHGDAIAGARVLLVSGTWSSGARLAEMGASFLEDGEEVEPRHERTTQSAHDGTFRLDGIDPYRRFSVVAVDELVGIGAIEAPTHATAEPVVVTLEPLVVVNGRVADFYGRPVPHTLAGFDYGSDALHLQGFRSVALRADGSFRFTTSERSGVLVPEAQCADGRTASGEPLSFPSDALLRRTVDLVLRDPVPSCRGRLVDAHGDVFDVRAALGARLLEWECAANSGGEAFGAQLVACRGEEPPPLEFRQTLIDRMGGIDLERSTYLVALGPEVRWIALVVRDRVVGVAAATLAEVGARGPDLRVDLSRLPSAPTRASVHVRLVAAESGAPLLAPACAITLDVTIENEVGQAIGVGFGQLPSRRDVATSSFWFDHVARGQVAVTARVAGRVAARRALGVASCAEPFEVELALARADADVRGVVVDAAGRGVAGASVAFLRGDGTAPHVAPSATTNADGRFHLLGIASGAGHLRVVTEAGPAAVLGCVANAGSDVGAVTLAPRGHVVIAVEANENLLEARIVGRGEGEPALDLAVLPPKNDRPEFFWTDPRGATRIERVEPGRYSCSIAPGCISVEVLRRDGEWKRRDAVVVSGETTVVDFANE
jgi:RNA polymerase sigma-70 factor (ECF subfamily)